MFFLLKKNIRRKRTQNWLKECKVLSSPLHQRHLGKLIEGCEPCRVQSFRIPFSKTVGAARCKVWLMKSDCLSFEFLDALSPLIHTLIPTAWASDTCRDKKKTGSDAAKTARQDPRSLALARTGGGLVQPPPLRFFADSEKTAARSAAGFWGALWGKPCAPFGKKKLTRSGQVTKL